MRQKAPALECPQGWWRIQTCGHMIKVPCHGQRRIGCQCSGDPEVLGLWDAKHCHGVGVGMRRVFSFHFGPLFKIHS